MPKFTKQHYEVIAKVILDSGLTNDNCPEPQAITNFLNGIMGLFMNDNSKFDSVKFFNAITKDVETIR